MAPLRSLTLCRDRSPGLAECGRNHRRHPAGLGLPAAKSIDCVPATGSYRSPSGPAAPADRPEDTIMIQLLDVSKVVPSGNDSLTILHSLDLTIPSGQFVSIIGPSGSGKSTLLGLIAGLDAPSSGQILLEGQEITSMTEDDLAVLRGDLVGFIFQSFHLIPSLTAFENILVPMEIKGGANAKARAQALLDEVGLHDRGHHYPSQLSGGEQQRVAIARAFANNPRILLADEPTGNLDSRNGAHIFELLLRINRERGATLVLVTHDDALANLADRRISLRDGKVVEDRLVAKTQEKGAE